jgi:DNA modification methylase
VTPYYADAWLTVYQGDCREVLPTLAAASVDCVVTSPPYWMQRSYLAADLPEKAREIGQEVEYADYQDTLVAICRELRRVLKPEGSLWLVLGDKFRANGGEYRYPGDLGKRYRRGQDTTQLMRRKWTHGYPPEVQRKSLLLVPYRIALALIADGWVLRDEIIWAKTNALPESVQDRFARQHEVLFRFTAGQRAYFDLGAVKRPLATTSMARIQQAGLFDQIGGDKQARYDKGRTHRQATRNLAVRFGGTKGAPEGVTRIDGKEWIPDAAGANPGDVWSLATSGARGRGFAHQAMFPPGLIERPILATSPRGGVILDPFAGTGTTAEVANALGRRSVLIELDPASLEAISVRTSKRPMVEVPA